MEKKTVTVTLRVPPEIHQKLKVISALRNVSMTDIVVDVVDKMKVSTPAFMEPGGKKPAKKKVPKRKGSSEETIKPLVMDMKAQGLSLQKICDALKDKGLLTKTGLTTWKKGTVTRMIQRWEGESDDKD
jgi:hypothetical protein